MSELSRNNDVMKPIASTGVYQCHNCKNEVALGLNCPICGHVLQGFLFEYKEFEAILTHLFKKATNKISIFFFGEQLVYSLEHGVGPERPSETEKPTKPTAKQSPKTAPKTAPKRRKLQL